MWCLREVPNETTGVPPYMLAMGHLPRVPLAILRDSWCGDKELPVSFGKNANKYLRELHDKLKIELKERKIAMFHITICVAMTNILMLAIKY